jgi:prephenate dehydrogenase
MSFRQVCIIGNGVFGKLLAERIRKFYGTDPIVFDKDDALVFPNCSGQRLIIVATPIHAIPDVLAHLVRLGPKNTTVTEIGSVKGDLFRKYENIVARAFPFFSSHPMTGPLDTLWGERDWKRKCIIISNPLFIKRSDEIAPMIEFWEELGFIIKTVDADEHDVAIGVLSHLSHYMILAYIKMANEVLTPEQLELAGTSFEKFKAMAAGAERLKDIYIANEMLPTLVEDYSITLYKTLREMKEKA